MTDILSAAGGSSGLLGALELERARLLRLGRDAAVAAHDAEAVIDAARRAQERIADAASDGSGCYRDLVGEAAVRSRRGAEAKELLEQLRVELRLLDSSLVSLGEGAADEFLDGAVSFVERFFDGVDVPLLYTCTLEEASARAGLIAERAEALLGRIDVLRAGASRELEEAESEYSRILSEHGAK